MTEQEKLELEESKAIPNEENAEEIIIEETAFEAESEMAFDDKECTEKPVKNRFWLGVFVGVLAVVFGCLLLVGVASGIWLFAGNVKSGKHVQMHAPQKEEEAKAADPVQETEEAELNMEEIGLKLNYIQDLIDTYYLFKEEKEREDPVEWIYSGYVYSLQDPYSVYYTPEEYKSLQESNEGEYCGIGVMVSQNAYTKVMNIVKVFKGAPAEKAGMLPGDILTGVDGLDVTGMDLSIVVNDHIKGEADTDVTITVYRQSEDEYLDLPMVRAVVQNPTIEYEMLEDQVGYIYLSSFEEVTVEQFKKAVTALEEEGMKGLVLDMRNNGGGIVSAAESIADYILPAGDVVVSFKGKGLPDSVYVTSDDHQMDIPIVVLVNGESASAAEILTGALKDNDYATVVGTTTFGKGIAQGLFPMPDGSALKLTTAYYYFPSGECIHEIGIKPDVEVELDEELKSMVEIPREEDNQLHKAVEVLVQKVNK